MSYVMVKRLLKVLPIINREIGNMPNDLVERISWLLLADLIKNNF